MKRTVENISVDRATILVVDDTPENLNLMYELLRDYYRVKIAGTGEKALAIAAVDPPPDLILLDVMMPGMDGHEVCRRLKRDPRVRNIPVVFLTAKAEVEDERAGLALGAVDYITKPISPPIVLARVQTHLKLKSATDFLRDKAAFLEQEVNTRTREVALIQDVTIISMASLAETRDADTGNHIRRTQHYVRLLAERLRSHPRFAAELDDTRIALLFKLAPLHDIGKVGIPDRILLKPGRLDAEEFDIMKTHAPLGHAALGQAEEVLGMSIDFLRFAREIVRSHHERWDGGGYPDGLAGDDIPLAARLMAVADVYDALVSRRVYKEGMPHAEAVKIIALGKGNQFDPDIVDAFVEIHDQFQAIAAEYADSDGNLARKRALIEQATSRPKPESGSSR